MSGYRTCWDCGGSFPIPLNGRANEGEPWYCWDCELKRQDIDPDYEAALAEHQGTWDKVVSSE